MAATTFAILMEMAGTAYDRAIIAHQFLKQDPTFRNLVFERTTGEGENFVQQEVTSDNTGAMAGLQDDYANTGIETRSWPGFLKRITSQKPVDSTVASVSNSATGLPKIWEAHRAATIEDVNTRFREGYLKDNPVDVVLGADQSTIGITEIVFGPRAASATDTHGTAATPTERRHSVKWVASSNTMSYQPYGETTYGTGVVFTNINYNRVPLLNADATRWIWVTGVFATLNSAGNLTPADTDATTCQVTPNLNMTGFLTYVHPNLRRFGNLSLSNPGATTGDAIDRAAMSWLARQVRRSGAAGTGAILCDPDMYEFIEAMLAALGLGEKIVTFMGEELNALSIGGVPIFDSDSMTEAARTAADGSTLVGRIMGIVYGSQDTGCHVRYNTVVNELGFMPEFNSGGVVDTGHGDVVAMPWSFYIIPPDSSNDKKYPRANMLIEPSTPRYDAVAVLDEIKYA